MSIEEIFEDQFLNRPATKVSIFLSVFDVHVNRSPIEGTITFQKYICGQYQPAYKKAASLQNEQYTIGIESDAVKVLVTQIAGIIARRIASWVPLGGRLQQGQPYGMIKFGSCTELIIPANSEIRIQTGNRVKGGITVIGKIRQKRLSA